MKIIDPIYQYDTEKLSAYIEIGKTGKEHEWDISVVDLSHLLGLDVKEHTERVVYGFGKGEDLIVEIKIDGRPIEYFFFTEEELIDAVTILIANRN